MDAEKAEVILIAYHFPPDPAIGGARPYRFYKYLKRAGRRCHVITAAPQADGAAPDIHFVPDPTAAFWASPVKRRLPLKAQIERAVRKYALPDTGMAWALDAARGCREILRRNPGRRFVVFSSYPPAGSLLAGFLTALRQNIPWIADFRDPLVNFDAARFPLASPVFFGLRAVTARTAGAIVANTGPLAEQWAEAFPRRKPKIHAIWNGFDAEERSSARPIPERPYRLLVHAGVLYVGRNPNLILESLARLRAKCAETRGIRMLLVGCVGYNSGLDQELCRRGVQEEWLDFRPDNIPRDQARQISEEADFLLLLQPQSKVQVPGKLFEYLAIGRPILAVAPPSSAAEYILANAGVPHVCIHPGDPPDAVDAKLLQFFRLPSTPVRFNAWFEDLFEAKRQAAQLDSIIDSLARKTGNISS
ncbi:MAG: glycosyltransferase [Acidobacteriia bacterium]|nr:glycosyltransferase [Terriglobia bacterium]